MLELLKNGLYDNYLPGGALYAVLCCLAVIIAGYLLGSLNFGIIISKKFFHEDVRQFGSKGSGANNMLRTYGKLPAAMTFLFDGIKAAVSAFIGALLLGYGTAFAGAYIGGLACIVGHAFPVYYRFKGGKSVAATFFMILCTEPLVALICLAVFIAVVLISRYVSLGSILSVLCYPPVLFLFAGAGLHLIVAIFTALLLVFFHRANIRRLLSGKESKISAKNRKKEGPSPAPETDPSVASNASEAIQESPEK